MKRIPIPFGGCRDENPSRHGHHPELPSNRGFEDGSPLPVPIAHADSESMDEKLGKELQEIVDRRVSKEVAAAVWEAVTRFAIETSQHKNPQLTLAAFCFAAGLYLNQGISETALAKKLEVSRQAFSKRVVEFTKLIGLPPSRGMKSELARESYKKSHSKIK